METSGVYFGAITTCILSVNLENIGIDISLNILNTQNSKHKANRYFRARNMLPKNNADVTHCEKTVFYFQNKAIYQAEDRPTDICLKITLT